MHSIENNETVRPGIKFDLNITEARSEEQRIIRRLAKTFHIGFFRQANFKEVNYTFVFAKPTNDFTLRFNLRDEVLVLFNKLDVFEGRTLDYVDKLMTEYSNRLDKLCVVLVSNDPNICKKVEDLNTKQQMSRVVVPFCYEDFFRDGQDQFFLENRFKRFFYARDLFDFDSPIRSESFFFGRSQTVQLFFDKFSNSENAALFGLRKIGKTSVLYAVKRVCDQKEFPVIYIDCQNPSFHKRRWFEALQYIVSLGVEQNTNVHKSSFSDVPYSEKDAAKLFESELRKLQTLKGNRQILLIFDEIENITFDISPTVHWSSGEDFLLFWQTLRSIFQSNRDIFSFILAGVNPKVLEEASIGVHDNPIYKIATPTYLELFPLDIVKEMVSRIGSYMGLKFEEEVCFLLHEDFGGHPFLTRVACSNLNKLLPSNRPQTVTKFWYKQNRDQFSKQVENYVVQLLSVLKHFYEVEYNMLEVLASGNMQKFTELVDGAPNSVEHLSGYGLVNTNNQEFYFKLRIVEDFLRNHLTIRKIFNTVEEKWSEVSRRRNMLESKLRRLALVLLQAKYGPQMKERILNALLTCPQ